MNDDKTEPCSLEVLYRELAGARVVSSRLYPDFTLDRLRAEVVDCRVIKANVRRQVFYLITPGGGYYLKRSTLTRPKDRVRHFLLPFRRRAEWRNLHRLQRAQVTVATPVIWGEKKDHDPPFFFLLTRQIAGKPLALRLSDYTKQLGQYLAFLHSRGIYHADLHPSNMVIQPDGQLCLLDVQQAYLLPWLPHVLQIHNLGKIFSRLPFNRDRERWAQEFLSGYNYNRKRPVDSSELMRAANRHQQRRYRSRTKRCCKNSTEFMIVNEPYLKGYRRRDFCWGAQQLRHAHENASHVKHAHVLRYKNICLKVHRRRYLHHDRCLVSWKMSRALEVRQIGVPRALGYFIFKRHTYFLSEFLFDSLHLNDYLSALVEPRQKRRVLQKLARWLKKIHALNIWQRDFKSNNILCCKGDYYLVDLDGVRIRRLSEKDKITNLAQLNASVSNAVTLRDRLRFFYYYASDDMPSRRQKREIYQRVWKITQTKNTLEYDLDLARL